MIRMIEALPPISDPYLGCEIKTLFGCYHTDWRRLSLYECDGAILLRYGSRAFLSGRIEKNVLHQFCQTMHINRIEALSTDLADCSFGKKSEHSIMVATTNNYTNSNDITKNDKTDIIFEILRQSDRSFAASVQYFYFLSEARTRINHNLGDIYLLHNCTTGAVWAKCDTHGLIGYVATLPSERKKGYGGALVSHIAADLFAQNKTPWLVSTDAYTDQLYEAIGFETVAKKAIIKV